MRSPGGSSEFRSISRRRGLSWRAIEVAAIRARVFARASSLEFLSSFTASGAMTIVPRIAP